MIAGHFGFAAMVKARERQAPLWALMLAAGWLDVIFVPLFLIGSETMVPLPDLGPGYGHSIIHADYTHSLLGAIILSVIYGLIFLRAWGRRTAIVLGLVVFSHWILDLVVHRMDMPLLPGNWGDLPRFGFGLWRWPAVSIVVELALVVLGAWLYWRAARHATEQAGGAKNRRADIAAGVILVSGLIVLALDASGIVG